MTGYAEFLDLKGRVLELGSGDGNTAAVLLPLCGNLVCADIAISSFKTLAMKNPGIGKAVAWYFCASALTGRTLVGQGAGVPVVAWAGGWRVLAAALVGAYVVGARVLVVAFHRIAHAGA